MTGRIGRWLKSTRQKIGQVLRTLAAQIRKLGSWIYLVLQIFHGVKGARETVETTAKVVTSNVFFRLWEYLWLLATAALVSYLKFCGISESLIFFVLWIVNMALCFLDLYIYDRTKVDFTLAAGFRRTTDALLEKSVIAGAILEFLFTVRLVFWDGASQYSIYIKRRVTSSKARFAIFTLTSLIQMAVWTYLLSRGYDKFMPFVKDFLSTLF